MDWFRIIIAIDGAITGRDYRARFKVERVMMQAIRFWNRSNGYYWWCWTLLMFRSNLWALIRVTELEIDRFLMLWLRDSKWGREGGGERVGQPFRFRNWKWFRNWKRLVTNDYCLLMECRRSPAIHVEPHVQLHATVEEDALPSRRRRRRNLPGRSGCGFPRSWTGPSLHNTIVLPSKTAQLRDELSFQVHCSFPTDRVAHFIGRDYYFIYLLFYLFIYLFVDIVPNRSCDEDTESGRGQSLPQSPSSLSTRMHQSSGPRSIDSDFEDSRHEFQHPPEVALSLCGLNFEHSEPPEELFLQSLVTYDDFVLNPRLMENPDLVVKIGDKYYRWYPLPFSTILVSIFQSQSTLLIKLIDWLIDPRVSNRICSASLRLREERDLFDSISGNWFNGIDWTWIDLWQGCCVSDHHELGVVPAGAAAVGGRLDRPRHQRQAPRGGEGEEEDGDATDAILLLVVPVAQPRIPESHARKDGFHHQHGRLDVRNRNWRSLPFHIPFWVEWNVDRRRSPPSLIR